MAIKARLLQILWLILLKQAVVPDETGGGGNIDQASVGAFNYDDKSSQFYIPN